MKTPKIIAGLALSLWANAGFGYYGSKYTYPQPPKVMPSDPMKVYPGSEIPQHPERFKWQITNKVNGKPISSDGSVKVYNFGGYGTGGGASVGTLTEGTPITLDEFRLVGRTHYYSTMLNGKKVWVSGLYIIPVSGPSAVK